MSELEMQDLITSYNLRLSKMGYTEEQSKKLSAILLEMYLWQVKNKIKHDLNEPDQCQFGWYVSSDSCNAYYLHTDGEMKWGADKAENNSKGYFKSYQEAKTQKDKYVSSN